MSTYARIAAERWPHAVIMGTDGRYAVVCPGEQVVYLGLTEQQQRNIALGVENPKLVDIGLRAIDFDKIPDREDASERRRRRREQTA